MIILFPGRGMMQKMARQEKGSLTGAGTGIITIGIGEFGFAHKIVQR
jgi:hypothetical protein